MYKLVRYLKFIVLLNIYNQDAKASHLKLRKNVPLLITIFKHKCLTSQTILFRGINIRFYPCFWITMRFELHGYS